VLHLFKGGAVFDALYQSIIQTRAFSAMRGSDTLFPDYFGEDLFYELLPFNVQFFPFF